jgi:hypothetical protein
MKKRRYNLTLDEESTEMVREWLERNNQTLSGWLNTLLEEFAHEIKAGPTTKKAPMEMTVKEFMDEMQHWLKKASEV